MPALVAAWRTRRHERSSAIRSLTWIPVALSLVAGGCAGVDGLESDGVGQLRQAIVDGDTDDVNTGVVGVGLVFNEQFVATVCTGTLLAPNLVLTARHCVSRIADEPDGRIECGASEFLQEASAGLFIASPKGTSPAFPEEAGTYRGRRIHVIPGASDDVCGYDLALVILRDNVPAEAAKPIVPRIDRAPAPEEAFFASGFGRADATSQRSAGIRRISDENRVLCVGSGCDGLDVEDAVRDTEWLALGDGACDGDSGGPALDSQGRVIGVVSRGDPTCAATIYGDVSAFGDFIAEVAVEAAELGGYEAPFWVGGSSEPPPALETTLDPSDVPQLDPLHGASTTQPEASNDVVDGCGEDCSTGDVGLGGETVGCGIAGGPSPSAAWGWWALLAVVVGGVRRRR